MSELELCGCGDCYRCGLCENPECSCSCLTPEQIEDEWARGIAEYDHDYTPFCSCRMCIDLG